MAEAPEPGSDEAERQKALDGAQDGAGEAEGDVGGTPMPMPIAGGGDKGGKDGKGGKGGKDDKGGDPQAGHSEGGGPGDHKGQTGVVEGGDLRAHANAKINRASRCRAWSWGGARGAPGHGEPRRRGRDRQRGAGRDRRDRAQRRARRVPRAGRPLLPAEVKERCATLAPRSRRG